MKTINIFRIFFLAMFFAAGCAESAIKQEIVIGIVKQHDTRINVICEVGKGKYIEKSVHGSQSVVCGAVTINAEDYLCGKKEYGPFPGHKNKFNDYLKSKGKK